MKRNNKLAILIICGILAIVVWVPKGRKTKDASATTTSVAFDQVIPVMRAVARKRTEFVDWGRNPFTFLQGEKKIGSISNLALSCIIWNDGKALALINESIVYVGDKIADKTVKRIEQNRVILTDGTKDYVLELQE